MTNGRADAAVGDARGGVALSVPTRERVAPTQRLAEYQDALDEGRAGWTGRLAGPPLHIVAAGYSVAMALHHFWYRYVPGTVHRVPAPVISIGNITTGGTGKTPLVIDVARRLMAAGRKPAVVARGYRAKEGKADELALIAEAAAGVVCIADPDRVRGAKTALAAHDADAIVLDDGFQHRRMGRDLDIVCVDATQPLRSASLMPRGRLREAVRRLRRAHLIVLTRVDQAGDVVLAEVRNTVRYAAARTPVISAVHRPGPLEPLAAEAIPPADQCRAYVFSGIGNPGAFAATAAEAVAQVVGETRLRDHHDYTLADVERLCRDAARCGANCLLTTAKDAVKLRDLPATWRLPVAVLPICIDFLDDGAKMLDALLSRALTARRFACGSA
jgi:tetraacyldisaccharide 4'-kinase